MKESSAKELSAFQKENARRRVRYLLVFVMLIVAWYIVKKLFPFSKKTSIEQSIFGLLLLVFNSTERSLQLFTFS